MAGMLPGVEVARRRRSHHHEKSRDPWILRPKVEPTTTTTTALDEITLRARTRLEQRLRGHASSKSSWSKKQSGEGEGGESSSKKEKGQRNTKETDVCAVCLDEFGVHQRIMSLPCSHTYHSDCLVPWLNLHSHCPYCRSHVPS